VSSISSIFSIAGNGLTTAAANFTRTAQNIARPNGLDDLTNNVVQMDLEKTSFSANALLLKKANQMTGTLLDVLDTDPR
jgi:hypothetical protein